MRRCIFVLCITAVMLCCYVQGCIAADFNVDTCTIGDVNLSEDETSKTNISLYDSKTGVFRISGTYSEGKLVRVEVYSGETVVFLDQVQCGDDGSYVIEGMLSEDTEIGDYTVKIGATLAERAVYKYFSIIDDTTVRSNLTVLSQGSIKAEINGISEEWGSLKTEEIPIGTQITLTAYCENDNFEFLYWKDKNSNIVLSNNEICSFILGSNRVIEAIFADKSSGGYVTFKNANNRIISGGYEVKVPDNPYIAGYTFSGWFSEGVKQNLAAGQDINAEYNTVYTAGYVKNDTKYLLTVENADYPGGFYMYNEKITLTAPDMDSEGRKFAYWLRDGAAVCYSNTYSFYIYQDTTVTAYYSSESLDVKNAVITMSAPVIIDNDRIAFYSEYNANAEYMVVEVGILLHTEEQIDLDSHTYKAVSKNTGSSGQFTVRKKNVSEGDTWYARAYLIYMDDMNMTHILYSDTVYKTFAL